MTDVINASRIRTVDLTGDAPLDGARADGDCFEVFYEAYQPRVRAFARKLVRDRHSVDDIVQETFLRAFHAGIHAEDRDEETEGGPWPWLATVTRNLVLDQHRRDRLVDPDEVDEEMVEVDDRRSDPAVVVLANRRRSGIAEALDTVCERQRRILVMKHVEGRRYEEIAEAEGISVEALKSVLARARRTFRDSYAVIAQRQGFGIVVGGGVLARVRGKLRALRTHAASMGDGMAQAFAAAPAAVNSAVTALALGTAAVAGAALASDDPSASPVERPALTTAASLGDEPSAPPSQPPVYANVLQSASGPPNVEPTPPDSAPQPAEPPVTTEEGAALEFRAEAPVVDQTPATEASAQGEVESGDEGFEAKVGSGADPDGDDPVDVQIANEFGVDCSPPAENSMTMTALCQASAALGDTA